jgi:hypothetical protein
LSGTCQIPCQRRIQASPSTGSRMTLRLSRDPRRGGLPGKSWAPFSSIGYAEAS